MDWVAEIYTPVHVRFVSDKYLKVDMYEWENTHEHHSWAMLGYGSLSVCLIKTLASTSGVESCDKLKTHECVILVSWVWTLKLSESPGNCLS